MRAAMRVSMTVLSGLCAATAAMAADDATMIDKAQVDALAPIAWMAGEWRGEATMQRPDGSAARMRSWERVIVAAGGTALLIQGRHHLPDADGKPGRVVHDAAGLLAYRPKLGKFQFVTQVASGRGGEFDAKVDGDKLLWWMPAGPGQQIRYEIYRNATGQWVEDGFHCRDDACKPFFKMTLDRQP